MSDVASKPLSIFDHVDNPRYFGLAVFDTQQAADQFTREHAIMGRLRVVQGYIAFPSGAQVWVKAIERPEDVQRLQGTRFSRIEMHGSFDARCIDRFRSICRQEAGIEQRVYYAGETA